MFSRWSPVTMMKKTPYEIIKNILICYNLTLLMNNMVENDYLFYAIK